MTLLEQLMGAPPDRSRPSGADCGIVEPRHRQYFAHGAGEPDFLRAAQLAQRQFALGHGLAVTAQELQQHVAGDAGQDLRAVGRRHHRAAEHRKHVARRAFGYAVAAVQDGFVASVFFGRLDCQHVRQQRDGFDIAASPADVGTGDGLHARVQRLGGRTWQRMAEAHDRRCDAIGKRSDAPVRGAARDLQIHHQVFRAD